MSDYKKITMQISPETFEFAKLMSDIYGYYGPEDFLHATLNRAILREMEEEAWPPEFDPYDPAFDLDDDLPF